MLEYGERPRRVPGTRGAAPPMPWLLATVLYMVRCGVVGVGVYAVSGLLYALLYGSVFSLLTLLVRMFSRWLEDLRPGR